MRIGERTVIRLADVIRCVIVFLLTIYSGGIGGEDATPSLPPLSVSEGMGLTNQARDKLPPCPPSADFVMKVVFSRFPGVSAEEVNKFMNEYFTQEIHEVKQMAEVLPDRAVERLTDIVQESINLMKIRSKDAVLFNKMMEEKRLNKIARLRAEAIREARGAERKKGIEELRKILEAAFEIRQELMKRDVERLEKEFEQLKQLVRLREQRKDEIINDRLTELVSGKAEVKW
jgi:hypothetical protein